MAPLERVQGQDEPGSSTFSGNTRCRSPPPPLRGERDRVGVARSSSVSSPPPLTLPRKREGGGRRRDLFELRPCCLRRRGVVELPLREVGGVGIPLVLLELQIGVGELVAEGVFQLGVLIEIAQGIEQVERQFRRAVTVCPSWYMSMS